jgi:hypothetical protein
VTAPAAPTPEAPPRLVRPLECPGCGGAITTRTGSWAATIACPQCGAVLDAQDPSLAVLQAAERRERLRPLIPLGTRGTLGGILWEVTGLQQRQVVVDGTAYAWREYLLFNPWHGFRYLSEYAGHWNEIEVIRRRPTLRASGHPSARLEGTTYKHFQTARAETTDVLGEFPWEVRRGDVVETADYVAPPGMLSREGTAAEESWSRGTYRAPEVIRQAFRLPTPLPEPVGVFANQPSPHVGAARRAVGIGMVLVLGWLGLLIANMTLAENRQVFRGQYRYDKALALAGATAADDGGGAYVTPEFTLGGRTSNVQLEIDSDVDQDWFYLNVALIDAERGTAREFGREVSYYSGRDSDGAWSEGSRTDRVRIGSVPPGRYYLRVEPEGGDPARIGRAIDYTLVARRDVPNYGLYALALVALVVPMAWPALRQASFEGRRWAESDHASAGSSDDDT